jgi:hypothetical protein
MIPMHPIFVVMKLIPPLGWQAFDVAQCSLVKVDQRFRFVMPK